MLPMRPNKIGHAASAKRQLTNAATDGFGRKIPEADMAPLIPNDHKGRLAETASGPTELPIGAKTGISPKETRQKHDQRLDVGDQQ